MMRRILIPSLIFFATMIFAVPSASASSSAVGVSPSNEQALVPGNYCISCHLANDPRLATVTDWKGSIAREVNTPCPAATKIHEELYYTERMLLMIDRAQEKVSALSDKQQTQLENYAQAYSRQLDEPVTSLNAFISAAQTTRFRLNKIYTSLNQTAETQKQRTVLIWASLVTLIVLGSLAWGLYNTRSIPSIKLKKSPTAFGRGVFVLAVLAFFALPIFRLPAAEVTSTTTEEQAAQSILDTADRAATTADRAQARSWILAQLGAIWNATDSTQAQTVLGEALTSLQQARENNDALWGQSLAVQETSIGVSIDMEKADLIAVDLNAARARDWSIPLIAVELNKVNPAGAAELLQKEQETLAPQSGFYRDLQLRGVALAWAEIEPSKAKTTVAKIQDASIRSWTLRELAAILKDNSLFDLALKAARDIKDPVRRAYELREIAVTSGNKKIFDEALSALDGVTGAPLAYALSDLVASSGDGSLVELIEPSYPDALTAALLSLKEYQAAWDASLNISDPYEQARAQAAIASAWQNADAAMKIKVPLYRDLALRDVTRKTGNATLTDSIHSRYYKVQTLTTLGDLKEAVQIADGLSDSYPLIELVSVLAKNDPQTAQSLVEKMTRESDKAIVLRIVAATTNDPKIFEQAQGMALAARVQGDSLAPAVASLDLADSLWTINPINAQSALHQAYEAAQRIPIK